MTRLDLRVQLGFKAEIPAEVWDEVGVPDQSGSARPLCEHKKGGWWGVRCGQESGGPGGGSQRAAESHWEIWRLALLGMLQSLHIPQAPLRVENMPHPTPGEAGQAPGRHAQGGPGLTLCFVTSSPSSQGAKAFSGAHCLPPLLPQALMG